MSRVAMMRSELLKSSVPALTGRLKDDHFRVREEAAEALVRLRDSRRPGDPGLRPDAKEAAVKTAPEPQPPSEDPGKPRRSEAEDRQLPALLKALKQGKGLDDRLETAQAILVQLGEKALPHLIAGLADEEDPGKLRGYRLSLLEVLARIGPAAREAAPAIERLKGEEGLLGERARQALEKILPVD